MARRGFRERFDGECLRRAEPVFFTAAFGTAAAIVARYGGAHCADYAFAARKRPACGPQGESGGNFALLANVPVAENSGNFPRLFAPPVRYENLIGVWDFIRFPILK